MPRQVFAVLANKKHKLPMPDSGYALFPPEGRVVDAEDPFWIACFADKSIKEHDPLSDEDQEKANAKAAERASIDPEVQVEGAGVAAGTEILTVGEKEQTAPAIRGRRS